MGTTTEIDKPGGLDALQIPLNAFCLVDFQVALPVAGDGTNPGFVVGTFGTDAPSIVGSDFGGTTIDEDCYLTATLPSDYEDGGILTMRFHAGVLTTVADDDAQIDVVCYKSDEEASVGADICTTAIQSINSLTLADFDFTITPTGLAPGDILLIGVNLVATDAGDLGVMQTIIGAAKFLYERQ